MPHQRTGQLLIPSSRLLLPLAEGGAAFDQDKLTAIDQIGSLTRQKGQQIGSEITFTWSNLHQATRSKPDRTGCAVDRSVDVRAGSRNQDPAMVTSRSPLEDRSEPGLIRNNRVLDDAGPSP